MFGIHHYLIFISAAVLLNVTPGADTMYIVGRTLAQGRRAGIASVLGISTGSLCHTIAAGLGLSTILATSASAFIAIKSIGAAYLVYLGFKMLRENRLGAALQNVTIVDRCRPWVLYRQGVFTNLLNPKVALFFLALLPQFVDARNHYPPLSFLLLGLTFVVTGTLWCLILVWSASAMSHYLRRNRQIATYLNRTIGALFIGLGLKLALADRQ